MRRISSYAAIKGISTVMAASTAAFLLCATTGMAQGSKVYRDPSGSYSVNVPSGWEAQPQQGSPMVSIVDAKNKVSVTVGVMKGPEANTPSAEAELKTIESQFPQSCPQAKIEERGQTKLAGLSGAFIVVHCTDATGPQLMKFTAASRPGVVALMVTASPGNAYLKDLLPLESIRTSFKALPAAGAQGMGSGQGMGGMQGGAPMQRNTAGGQQGMGGGDGMGSNQGMGGGQPPMQGQPQPQTQPGGEFPSPGGSDSGAYHDPQGRYSLAVPSGWNTASDNGNLTLSSGSSWVSVATSNGAQPADVSHQIVQQIQAQYKQFQILNEGDFQNNGHPSHGTNATGVNPKGVRVSVLVVTIGAGGGHYLVLISSAPNDQAKQINSTVMQIAQSVKFGG